MDHILVQMTNGETLTGMIDFDDILDNKAFVPLNVSTGTMYINKGQISTIQMLED